MLGFYSLYVRGGIITGGGRRSVGVELGVMGSGSHFFSPALNFTGEAGKGEGELTKGYSKGSL